MRYWLIDSETIEITGFRAEQLLDVCCIGLAETTLEAHNTINAVEFYRHKNMCSIRVVRREMQQAVELAHQTGILTPRATATGRVNK